MSSTVPVLLTRAEVLSALRIKKSKLHADIAEGKFPRPVKFGSKSFFIQEEISAWVQQRLAERDSNAAREAPNKPTEVSPTRPD